MKMFTFIGTLLCLLIAGSAHGTKDVFPYTYFIDDLPNGLRVITVPTDHPNIVALQVVMQVGSRNEVEPGKSGFAHFFEHMMFRGTKKFPAEKYQQILKRAGVDSNAYTSDDLTVYHSTFSAEDLETLLMVEADRFQNLTYSVEDFKTEAKAVLGEYNKNSANPLRKMLEVLRDTAFTRHPYKHTTMGFLRDIEDMPNQYEYSRTFFQRYYRPEYATIIVVGDVTRERVVSLVKKYWGSWPRGSYVPDIPAEPEQTEPKSAHIDWPMPTLPWIMIAYKGPAYSDEAKDMATMDIIANLAFSPSSELYRRLVIKEQKVDQLFPLFSDHRDPYLLIVAARVKDEKDLDYVKERILQTFASLKTTPVSRERLEAVKSHLRYSFALSLDDPQSIADTLAHYVALRRTPETINKLYRLYDAITVEDVQAMARKYFVKAHRTIVTLASKR
ncbi:MAG: insulinase family protein [Acidobacteria bacterium]|nr:MAG: insulinase family protein [Acidobacteriota bacterium]